LQGRELARKAKRCRERQGARKEAMVGYARVHVTGP